MNENIHEYNVNENIYNESLHMVYGQIQYIQYIIQYICITFLVNYLLVGYLCITLLVNYLLVAYLFHSYIIEVNKLCVEEQKSS